MCGIFGTISASSDFPALAVVKEACRLMAHRGPDAEGIWQEGKVVLGHRRLSIIDLAEGGQPMKSLCGRYVICYNGEIYNHVELRRQLSELGVTFRTRSDTETLMAAYATWGVDCLLRLEGMFAFAIADCVQEELFLCRDLFGIKPLFYRLDRGNFLFSSELPPLDTPLLPPLAINPAAPALFFRYQYIPSPHSMFQDVYKLPAAHYMKVDFNGRIRTIESYGDFTFTPEAMSREDAVELADKVIAESVSISTRSDVPVGVFLSGGIDSTLVAMNVVKTLGHEIPAFTIDFADKSRSERSYAETAAKVLGLELHVTCVDEPDLDNIERILSFYGEPFGDASVLPSWHVSRLARQYCTVSMSGDGGDELFAGYHNYASWLRSLQSRHGRDMLGSLAQLRFKDARYHLRQLQKNPRKTVDYWHSFFEFLTPEFMRGFLREPYAGHCHELAPALQRLAGREKDFGDLDLVQYMDLHSYQADGVLHKVDRTSMQHSLEVRPPLLTASVLRMALRLPPEHRFTVQERGKAVLKDILRKSGFDDAFLYRRKRGFGIPLKAWFLPGGRARTLLEEMLSDHGKDLDQFFDVQAARSMLLRHTKKHNLSSELWQILAFACWLKSRQTRREQGRL